MSLHCICIHLHIEKNYTRGLGHCSRQQMIFQAAAHYSKPAQTVVCLSCMDLFQVSCEGDRRSNLRNTDFILPCYNTVTNGKHSIRYLGPSIWTKLTEQERTIKSLSAFRTMICKKGYMSAVLVGRGRDCKLCST